VKKQSHRYGQDLRDYFTAFVMTEDEIINWLMCRLRTVEPTEYEYVCRAEVAAIASIKCKPAELKYQKQIQKIGNC
jgi:hypothetical protein